MTKKIKFHNFSGQEFEVPIEQVTFRPSVYGILIEDEQILLSKQWDGYDLPGGGAKIYETIDQALRREFFEETGLEVELGPVVHCETSFYNPTHSARKKDLFWNCPMMYFLVNKLRGELSAEHLDADELAYATLAEWVPLDKLAQIKFMNTVDPVAIIKKVVEVGR